MQNSTLRKLESAIKVYRNGLLIDCLPKIKQSAIRQNRFACAAAAAAAAALARRAKQNNVRKQCLVSTDFLKSKQTVPEESRFSNQE
jgi:hypothetical protein